MTRLDAEIELFCNLLFDRNLGTQHATFEGQDSRLKHHQHLRVHSEFAMLASRSPVSPFLVTCYLIIPSRMAAFRMVAAPYSPPE